MHLRCRVRRAQCGLLEDVLGASSRCALQPVPADKRIALVDAPSLATPAPSSLVNGSPRPRSAARNASYGVSSTPGHWCRDRPARPPAPSPAHRQPCDSSAFSMALRGFLVDAHVVDALEVGRRDPRAALVRAQARRHHLRVPCQTVDRIRGLATAPKGSLVWVRIPPSLPTLLSANWAPIGPRWIALPGRASALCTWPVSMSPCVTGPAPSTAGTTAPHGAPIGYPWPLGRLGVLTRSRRPRATRSHNPGRHRPSYPTWVRTRPGGSSGRTGR